jgi:hypothetical protein
MTEMNFLFRKPRFPIIIDTGNGLLGAKSWAVCERRLATITFPDMAPRDVIDSSAEAFSLYPEHMAFSPLTFKKRWTKVAIIELYNGSKGPRAGGVSDHIARQQEPGEGGQGHRRAARCALTFCLFALPAV